MMVHTKAFYIEKEQQWEVIDAHIKRQIVGYDDNLMMVNVHFKTGGIGALHHHKHSQVTYVAEGKFEVSIAGETKLLQKGDSFFISSNVEHGVVCLEEGMLIDVFSPKREDLLNN